MVASVIMVAGSAHADDDDLTDLEDALAADAADAADTPAAQQRAAPAPVQRLQPDIAFILDVALGWFSDADPIQSGGHDPTANGFNLQQVEMAVGQAVDPYFRLDGTLVFSSEGVELEEMYATTLALPHSLQLRVGQLLTRFGRANATHLHAWEFVDQPLILGRYFGGEGNRGLGAEVSYLTPLPWYVELVASLTDPSGEGSARSFYGDSDLGLERPWDLQATVALKQFFDLSPNWSLLVGTSVATGPNPTGDDNRTDIYGADVFLKYRPVDRASDTVVTVQGEWIYRRREIPGDRTWDHGGYVHAVWRFARRWSTAARYEYGQHARGAGGSGRGDELDPMWTEPRHRVAAALTFLPTEFSRVRAQVSLDRPGWLDDPIIAGFLACEFVIGAHGAHPF